MWRDRKIGRVFAVFEEEAAEARTSIRDAKASRDAPSRVVLSIELSGPASMRRANTDVFGPAQRLCDGAKRATGFSATGRLSPISRESLASAT